MLTWFKLAICLTVNCHPSCRLANWSYVVKQRICSSQSFLRKKWRKLHLASVSWSVLCRSGTVQLYICSRLKTVFLELFVAKNRIIRGLPLRLSTLHQFRPFLSYIRIPREPKKTNAVVICVGTRSSHTVSRYGA